MSSTTIPTPASPNATKAITTQLAAIDLTSGASRSTPVAATETATIPSTVRLSVPLDARPPPVLRHKPSQRDSLERRETILRGAEGTRARRRYENSHMLNNPWAEPPLPSDWEVRPTYPVRRIPYYLAPLWDAAEFQRAVESKLKGRRNTSSKKKKRDVGGATGVSPFEDAASGVPKEVRARLKHARSAKGLLQDLEEDVRAFLHKWNARELRLREDGLHDIPSAHAVVSDTEGEDEEEIVFVGRAGTRTHESDLSDDKVQDEESLLSEKLVFEGLEDDRGASFARWLTHCIGSYYGLKTWSVSTRRDDENLRQAYVGVDARVRGWMGRGAELGRDFELPKPLWGMV